MKFDCDFVVAGSGAGGSAVAARLADGGARVLLAEAGPRARPQEDAARAINLYYANAGLTAGLGNGLFALATGRTVGGTTTINSGTCLRPPSDAPRRWAAAVPGFDADAFSADVEDAWRTLKVAKTPERLAGESTRLFFQGLERLGVRGAEYLDRAAPGCDGAGRCCFVCPRGAKVTAQTAFLEPSLRDGRLDLRAGWRLLSAAASEDPGRPAEAVLVDETGRRRRLRARAVILACGSLATPYHLRRLGVRAGDGLTIHPAAKVFALFDREVRGWSGVPQAGGLQDEAEPRLRFEGAFVPPEIAPLTMPLEGRRLTWWLERYAHVASFGFMVRDCASGRVRYPLGPEMPLIRYAMAPQDVRLMARGMELVARAYLAAGASRVLLPLNRLDNEFESAAQLDAFNWSGVRADELQTMGFHPLGTAGLGRATDGGLRAAPGVYVADGSVVPESLGVNPQITIYAFALGLARRLLAEGA